MKKTKFVILFFLLAFLLISENEIYQVHLDSFTKGLSYFEVDKTYAGAHMALARSAKEKGITFFCMEKQRVDMFKSVIRIYADEDTLPLIGKKCGIKQGTYESLFSGVTQVITQDYEQIGENGTTYYFLADAESVKALQKEYLKNGGKEAYLVHTDKQKNGQWIELTAASLVTVLLLLLTWFELKFNKKKNLLLISLGKTKSRLIIKNIGTDGAFILLLAAIFTVLRRNDACFQFYLIKNAAFLAILTGLNSLMYLTMLKYNIKQSLSRASFADGILSDIYVIKAVTMIFTCIVLFLNAFSVPENGRLLEGLRAAKEYDSMSFMKISPEKYESDEDEQRAASTEQKIFADLYKKNKVTFSVLMVAGERDILLIDKGCSRFIRSLSLPENALENRDFLILYPFGTKASYAVEESLSVLERLFSEVRENARYDSRSYGGIRNVPYFDASHKETEYLKISRNPIIIYCDFSQELIDHDHEAWSIPNITNMLFDVDEKELERIEKDFALKKLYLKASLSSAKDKEEYVYAATARVFLLSAVLSILMLILEFSITAITVKLEYMENAMSTALKKITGYSVLSRNKWPLLLNLLALVIGLTATAELSGLLRLANLPFCLLIGAVLWGMEALLIFYYVRKLDKTNVQKILKGGCL